MKPSKSQPEWYHSLQVDPLRKRTFNEELARKIKSRAFSQSIDRRRIMRGAAWLAAGVLSVGITFFAFQTESVKSWLDAGSTATPPKTTETTAEKSIAMTFHSNEIEQLLPMKTRPASNPAKSIPFSAKNGLQSITIHLYEDTKNVDLITAYLEDDGVWYSAGLVSSEGLQLVNVKLGSWTGKEIQLTGPISGWTTKILRYNEARLMWEMNDFEGHPTTEIDLDGDGINELVSPEEYAVPPMVTVHHWNMESKVFQSAQVDPDASKMYNIDRDKQLSYSFLFRENGGWLIEFGTGNQSHHFLQYKNEKLIEVKLADNRSRLEEFQNKNHKH
jgi:hypothetical protein